MKIIVTGALGHIGSRFIREAASLFTGAEIVMIDNFATQRYASLFNLPAGCRYRFVEGDVVDMDLESMLGNTDAVLHLAALTDAATSFERKDEVERNNMGATEHVGLACAATGTPMIFVSSTSVYGKASGVVDETCDDSVLKPQSPYAETKLREERRLCSLGESSGLRFVICRFGTICGASPGMRFHTAVNRFCWQAVMGVPLTVWRTALHQKRPYLALSDAVAAFTFIITNGFFPCRVYNVLTDNLTVNDILDLIRREIPELEVTCVDSEIMNQLSYEVSNAAIAAAGFHSRGSIEQSISDTVSLLRRAGDR